MAPARALASPAAGGDPADRVPPEAGRHAPDPALVRRAARDGFPLRMSVDAGTEEPPAALDEILEVFLTQLGQEAILALLAYCVRELLSNARKALLKRAWFKAKGLDIARADHYEEGMRRFRADVSEHAGRYLQALRARGAKIDLVFRCAGGVLSVAVRNEMALLPAEMARIQDRLARARTLRAFTDALESAVDETEGAGLGIMVLVQFLRKIGVGDEGFSIVSENGSTVASVVVPATSVHLDQLRALTDRLVREIEALPHLPESVLNVLRASEPADARISDIARAVADDPALTADLLRHVNSSWYGLSTPVSSAAHAVMVVGIRGLRTLLYSFGFQWLLFQQHLQLKDLQEHAHRAAFYAALLAVRRRKAPGIADECYTAGVLHDLGRIVLASLRPEALERIRRFSAEKGIPPQLLERFSFGMNHAEVGARIAEKWSLPGVLVEAIRWHHEPGRCTPGCRPVVSCVYLANALCDVERGLLPPEQIDSSVLRDFDLQAPGQVEELCAALRSDYERRPGPPGSPSTLLPGTGSPGARARS